MKKTQNINLDLFGISLIDREQKFKTWRLAMCGEEDSNMIKIDDKFGEVDINLGKKTDKTYTDEKLALKTDKTYVDQELAKKSDTSYVNEQLGRKSDKSYVDTELSKKANDVLATPSTKGQMSPADKSKLDSIILGTGDTTIDITNHNINESAHPFIQSKIDNKTKIDDVSTDIVFGMNKVVQSGLVDENTLYSETESTEYTYILKTKVTRLDTHHTVLGRFDGDSGWRIAFDASKKTLIAFYKSISKTWREVSLNETIFIVVQTIRGKLYITINGEKIVNGESFKTGLEKNKPFGLFFENQYKYIFNRTLSTEEIQKYFTVLNNTPSINKINNKSLATDTYHVNTPTGITTEERYTGLLKTVCKEFSSNGEKITVNNVIPNQKILSGEIKGQTVKCYTSKNPVNNGNNIELVRGTNRTISINDVVSGVSKNTSYKFIFNVKAMDIVKSFGVQIALQYKDTDGSLKEDITSCNSTVVPSVGTNVLSYTTGNYDYTGIGRLYLYVNMNDVEASYITLEPNFILIDNGEEDKVIKNKLGCYTFGLNSTEAIINDNPIYEPMINGATKVMKATKGQQNWTEISPDEVRDTTTYDYKLVSNNDLGSVPTVCDYIDRARKVKVINTKEIVLNGSEDWSSLTVNTNTIRCWLGTSNAKPNSEGLCNNVPYLHGDSSDSEHIRIDGTSPNGGVLLWLNKSRLTSQDISGFKTWLSTNPITVRYQLATPIEVPLTDEEITAYDQYRKIIELGKVGDVCDTLEIKEDGSGVLVQNSINGELTGSNSWVLVSTYDSTVACYTVNNSVSSGIPNIVSDTLPNYNDLSSLDKNNKPCIYLNNSTNGRIIVMLNKTDIGYVSEDNSSTLSVKFNDYFKSKRLTFKSKLSTPITTHIPKELVPQILSQTDYTFSNAVLPSGVKISVPVDKIAELESQIVSLTSALNTLTADFVTHTNAL